MAENTRHDLHALISRLPEDQPAKRTRHEDESHGSATSVAAETSTHGKRSITRSIVEVDAHLRPSKKPRRKVEVVIVRQSSKVNTKGKQRATDTLKVKVEDVDPADTAIVKQEQSVMDSVKEEDVGEDEAWASAIAALSTKPKIEDLEPGLPAELGIGIEFNAEAVRGHVDTLGRTPFPITLNPVLSHVPVSRGFMSAVYGGNGVETFPAIGKDQIEEHGLDSFVYMSLDFNPAAPHGPGHPGLWFNTEPFTFDGTSKGPWRMFVRLRANAWLYVGQYIFFVMEDLSQEGWLLLPEEVQKLWAYETWKFQWGLGACVRITLRQKLKRDPTPEEVKKAMASGEKFQDISPKEILAAYNKGEEHLYVAGMKCVGYDEMFQCAIAKGFPIWSSWAGKDATRKRKRKSWH
ncbi:hypothetical protein DENSPDRAFT_844664 [Dentipellis sp. KUC8613]|nr:hypothetical protein DENSPDRAFT_844664 [Dentipellis sp. KUC8613]